jgi:enoyl-CoA hydratase/carnithine racemase
MDFTMAYFQVRDFPEELSAQLRELAKKEHRSVAQQAIVAIEEHVARAYRQEHLPQAHGDGFSPRNVDSYNYLEKRQRVFERIHALPKPKNPGSSEKILAAIHEGRAERDDRLGL